MLVLDARSFDASTAGDTLPLADICLGYNEPEPMAVVRVAAECFKSEVLSVEMNDPIRGCSLPRGYDGHSSTFGMTVAINRRLYVGENRQPDAYAFDLVKTLLYNLYQQLVN